MDSQNQNNPRQTYKGNWVCSKCKSPITELPFQPDENRLDQLVCRDCYRAKKQSYNR